jgi:hypothetical protein
VGANLRTPFDFLLEKTLLFTIGGMLVTSFLVLLVFSNPRSS